MSMWRLFFEEIRFRRWSFALAVLSVVVAVGCLTAELTILRLHDAATDTLLATNMKESAERLAAQAVKIEQRLRELEDDYRKITKKLDFNILIVSDKEDLPLMDQRKVAMEHIPETYVEKLAQAKIVTIQHLLPMLQAEVDWPGLKGKVIVNGVRGEVPILHASEKKPLLEPVPKGNLVLGYYVHQLLGVKKGETVTFQGRDFKVHALHPYRGENRDDWTVWMNLAEAQQLFGQPGQINVILALECNCSAPDRLAEVRSEVTKILPHTQVLEFATKALVRAEARERAKKEAQVALAQERTYATIEMGSMLDAREQLRDRITGFAAFLVPLVLIGCIVWLGVVTLGNVRERASEIGILRALGLASRSIYLLFIGRAVLVGFVGALLGCILGCAAGLIGGATDLDLAGAEAIFVLPLPTALLVATPALCAFVGWLAARAAVGQDPAVVLHHA